MKTLILEEDGIQEQRQTYLVYVQRSIIVEQSTLLYDWNAHTVVVCYIRYGT